MEGIGIWIAIGTGALCAALLLAVLATLGKLAGRFGQAVPGPVANGQVALEIARITHERDSALRAQEEGRAALEQERTAHAAARDRLSKAEGDLREAAVHAGRAPALEAKLIEAERRANDAEKSLDSALAGTKERDEAHRREVAALVQFKEDMKAQFKALSSEALAAQSETFTKSSKERLETLLNPLREQIGTFQSAFVQDGQTRAEQSSELRTTIGLLTQQTGKTQETAENLARALKGSSKTQGSWGEMLLESVLQNSGLNEGTEFVRQESRRADDGSRIIPDVVVKLPNGQSVIVDSKVSLVAFEQCVNCEDDTERELHVRAHLSSLRNHIRGLSDKDYSAHYGNIDFVLMFVPVEGALSLALKNEPELAAHAISRNVFLTTPMTLHLALRTVENLWRVQRQNQNADEIARVASKLYSGFVDFVEAMKGVKVALGKADDKYEEALKRLHTGRDNLVRLSQRVVALGAKSNKSIPEDVMLLADHIGAEDVEEDAKIISVSNAAHMSPGDER